MRVVRLFAGPHIGWLDRIEPLLRYPSEYDGRGLINIATDNAEVHSSITIVNESPFARTVRFVSDAMLPVEVKGIPAAAEEYFAYLQHIDPFTLQSGESKVIPITFTIAATSAGSPAIDFLDFDCLERELDYLRRALALPGAVNQGNEYAVSFKVDTGHGEIREYPIIFRTTRVSNFPDSILNPFNPKRFEPAAATESEQKSLINAYIKIASISRRANSDLGMALFISRVSFAFKAPEAAAHKEIEPDLIPAQMGIDNYYKINSDDTTTEILEFAGVDPTSGVSHNWSVANGQVLVTFEANDASLEKIVVCYNRPGPRAIRGFQLLSMTWHFKHAQAESVNFA